MERACEAEYEILGGYYTWKLVDQPLNINIISSCWTFRVKQDNHGQVNRYKARLVVQGFSQVEGIDYEYMYSPTIRMTTIQLILALVTKYDLKLRMVDMKGAYLNGKLDDTVYMHQPEGFIKK